MFLVGGGLSYGGGSMLTWKDLSGNKNSWRTRFGLGVWDIPALPSISG